MSILERVFIFSDYYSLPMKDLVMLIEALSPSEKQHFKKRNNPDADFVMLFDYINKTKSCISSEVSTYFSKKQIIEKTINSNFLSGLKNYLKVRILESLRVQFINKKKKYELLSNAMNADLLLEKGLYSLAKMEIESSFENNFDSSFPIERLLLLRRKSLLVYYENYEGTSLEDIESLFRSRIETAEQLLLEIRFARIISIMSFQFFNGLNDIELLKSFMNEPYMKDESLATDFVTKYLFHWVHAQFEEFQNNPEGAIKHFNRSIGIWLDNTNYIDAHPRMYLSACYTYFKYLIQQQDPFSPLLTEINFDDLLSKIKTENLGFEEEEKHQFLFQLFEILALRKRSKWGEIIRIVNPLINDQNKLERVPSYDCVILFYYSALANFTLGNISEAERILFYFLNPLDKRLASNPSYSTVYILLNIVILLEKGDEKHLRLLLPKFKKYLNQEGKLTQFAIHFISMASQLISPRFKLMPDLVYERFHERLIECHGKEVREIKIEYDYLVSWVKKKEKELF